MLLDTVTMNSKKQCLMNGQRTMTANIYLLKLYPVVHRCQKAPWFPKAGWRLGIKSAHDDIHPPPSAIKMTYHLVHVGMDSLASHEDN